MEAKLRYNHQKQLESASEGLSDAFRDVFLQGAREVILNPEKYDLSRKLINALGARLPYRRRAEYGAGKIFLRNLNSFRKNGKRHSLVGVAIASMVDFHKLKRKDLQNENTRLRNALRQLEHDFDLSQVNGAVRFINRTLNIFVGKPPNT